MKRLSRRMLLTGGATALAVGASAGVALAVAITFSISPGGAITAKAGKTTLTDTKTHTVLTCASSSSSGTLKKGHGISGAGLGTISKLSFSTCTGPLSLTFTVKTTHFPWHLNAKTFSGGVTTGTISGIHATLSGPSCSAVVDGTSATANNGMVTAKYSNSTGKLTTTGAGNLHIYNVSGCAGLINTGDATQFTGVYTVSPTQKITSP